MSRLFDHLSFLVVSLALTLPLTACAFDDGNVESRDSELWLTVGTDALDTVARVLGADRMKRAVHESDNPEVAIVWVRSRDLEPLAVAMHEDHLRCAGFRVHRSLDDARAAAATPPPPPAARLELAVNNPVTAAALTAGIDEAEILATISALSSFPDRRFDSATGVEAAELLAAKWTEAAGDRDDVIVEIREHDDWAQPSVIATVLGAETPGEVVVLGGHLDSISFFGAAPGADDDASGIASLTEVFRVAMAAGYRPQRTVKFMAYAAEEVGLRGSSEIADELAAAGTDVVGAMQLDMTNFTRSSEVDLVLISDHTSPTLTEFVGEVIDVHLPELEWTLDVCGYACSDHASWTAAGYPAVYPFEAPTGQFNENIHTSGDTLELSGNSAAHAAKFSRVAAAYIAEVAGGAVGDQPQPPPPGDLDHLIIAEVGYDVPGTDSLGEYVVLHNSTGAPVELGGLSLDDNGGTFALPNVALAAGASFALARDADGFVALYGRDPDAAGMSLALGNGGDRLELRRGADPVDEVEWESADWPIAATTGNALRRADLGLDTDGPADWISGPADP